MGLMVKPSSFYACLKARIFNWNNLKAALSHTPFDIEWDQIVDVLLVQNKASHYALHFRSPEGEAFLHFNLDDVQNPSEFEDYLEKNPQKIVSDRLAFYKPHFQYGAIAFKYLLGILAFTFIYFQLKYVGSLLIQKYHFLEKGSCNTECADQFWSMSSSLFYLFMMLASPIVPVLFYRRIYRSVLQSKNISIINTTLAETWMIGLLGLIVMISSAPKMAEATSKYSKIISSYADGTLGTPTNKILRKIGMSSTE